VTPFHRTPLRASYNEYQSRTLLSSGVLFQSSNAHLLEREDDSCSNKELEEQNSAHPSQTSQDKDSFSFRIENCKYADLNVVSDIIMDSFYDGKVGWRRLLKLAELNRLQLNFPYVDTDLHRMLVAVMTSSPDDTIKVSERIVVGFVDVDARPCKPEIKLPRPYLSDLAVDPNYRRRGIAQALIETCEEFVQNIPKKELYIRVEETNEAAVEMYINKLNYETCGMEKLLTTDMKRVITLHKSFDEAPDEKSDQLEDITTSQILGDKGGSDVDGSNDEPDFVI
jgi:ribosomal protein S18 acetylase RimI-like enzyme